MKQPNKEHSNSPRVKEGCKSEMPVHKVKSHKEAEPSLDTHTPDEYEKEMLESMKLADLAKDRELFNTLTYMLTAYRKGKTQARKEVLKEMKKIANKISSMNGDISYPDLIEEIQKLQEEKR